MSHTGLLNNRKCFEFYLSTCQQRHKVKDTYSRIKPTLYSHSNLTVYLWLRGPQIGSFFPTRSSPAVLSVINGVRQWVQRSGSLGKVNPPWIEESPLTWICSLSTVSLCSLSLSSISLLKSASLFSLSSSLGNKKYGKSLFPNIWDGGLNLQNSTSLQNTLAVIRESFSTLSEK